MGKFYDEIPDFLFSWLPQQELFWVATAPLSGGGHVNVSPKGLKGTFHVESATEGTPSRSPILLLREIAPACRYLAVGPYLISTP